MAGGKNEMPLDTPLNAERLHPLRLRLETL
jgi:hypothetical protein